MRYLYFCLLIFILSCGGESLTEMTSEPDNVYFWLNGNVDAQNTIASRITPPDTYQRIEVQKGSFGDWIRNLPLKPAGTSVSNFDGTQKEDQDFHEAVVDIDLDSLGLQQAPQSIIRLKSEYHFGRVELDKIQFNYTGKDGLVTFSRYAIGEKPIVVPDQHILYFYSAHGYPDSSHNNLKTYLGEVNANTGTTSLKRVLKQVNIKDIMPGDIFIEAGNPGHAVLVTDVVQNGQFYKMFLLAQGGTPTQDFHVLKNLSDPEVSPWYSITSILQNGLQTPEWTFTINDLYRFE
jgi:hypothetical protein